MHPYHHPLFVKFIVYFNQNQDYFECHEVLEEYWKSLPESRKEHPLTAFILLATGMYHWRRENFIGALRTLRKAEIKFSTFLHMNPIFTKDIDFVQLQSNLRLSLSYLEHQKTFTSFEICMTSSELVELVTNVESSMNLLPIHSNDIIHKHMLRDRTDILKEREEKKKGRHQ